MRKIPGIFARFLGILLFLFICFFIDFRKIWLLLKEAKLIYLILPAPLFLVNIFIKGYRWKKMLKLQEISLSLSESFRVYSVSILFGLLTPGRVGELTKAVYLKAKGFSSASSFASVIVDRLADIVSLLLIGYVSLIAFYSLFQSEIIIIGIIFIGSPLVLFILLKRSGLGRRSLLFMAKKFDRQGSGYSIENKLQDFLRDFNLLLRKGFGPISLLTMAAWVVYFFQLYLFSLSLNFRLPVSYFVAFVSISLLISFLPVSIAGIGTRDGALIGLFSLIGLSRESAVTFSFLFLYMYLINALTCGLIYLKEPVNLGFNLRSS
jgi:hypothetical protein